MEIKILKTDITTLDCDAIVNAANTSLLGGGGVDGAIHRAAGPGLLTYCRGLNGCSTGMAKISPGYNLKAQWVIHTVGPVWNGGHKNEDQLLMSCYRAVFDIANEKKLKTIAFPAISTGVYGFPKERAVILVKECLRELQMGNTYLKSIIFAIFDEENFLLYNNTIGNS
jgi:O-acetyl-ADP-ribose deacetylase (regulator of RNase III)